MEIASACSRGAKTKDLRFLGGESGCYFLRIRRPGSETLVEIVAITVTVGVEQVVGASSYTVLIVAHHLDVSLYPVVTEPMILRLPSRMKSFFIILVLPPAKVYSSRKSAGFGRVIKPIGSQISRLYY